jgi:ABC-type nickel/cobalt efflux system permease component RcnA
MTEANIVLSVSMAAALILFFVGLWALRQPGANRTKSWLMIVAGVVIAFNGWIYSLPPPPMPGAAVTPSAR